MATDINIGIIAAERNENDGEGDHFAKAGANDPQKPLRDISSQYSAHVHDFPPYLTLQGAVAHTDMPVEAGPTKLLLFSQLYRVVYAAWRREDFRKRFRSHCKSRQNAMNHNGISLLGHFEFM